MNLIQDLPKGPLDVYRKQASFNWKSLKFNLFGEDLLKFQDNLYNYIKKTPAFHKMEKALTLDETRQRCYEQFNLLVRDNVANVEPKGWFNYLFSYDSALGILIGLNQGMIQNTIMNLGTERHAEILNNLLEGKYTCCFSLTEIGHGTNAKGIETTAKYNPQLESFIFHSPGFQSAKCWSASLGKAATHALIYAQLITADNKNHGLYPFLIQIRDEKTFLPMPGVTVGDMGAKIGLNGIDNGFLIFNHFPVPRASLLNKNIDVTKDGQFVSKMKDKKKLFGASVGVLSGGRLNITAMSLNYLTLAVVIAIRYSAVRKQFEPSPEEEWPVIEYQVQQCKLFPHLATTYAITLFSQHCLALWDEFNSLMYTTDDNQLVDSVGTEIHAISAAVKPLCSWLTQSAIQECREACGGHGYLKVSRLGDLRADNDANCTYEGENTVLIQQTSNWLLNQWRNVLNGSKLSSPLRSINFLENANSILTLKFNCTTMDQTMQIENLLLAFKWLLCYYLKNTYEKVELLENNGSSKFEARNNSQTYFARSLSLIYAELGL
ncbi:peroxisomal acyl-coenzyme A oxidase 3-like isoform X2 [Leptopilina heterotoma]|uniref:peroxisomal acyl-coenzyme A oxidase 3-like isoform X2 n=1 Tax=Leptopilina heterotoma TaxID=63436 RepID=UPI001CA8628E|nr:peroxisomal acyl-coenzyme A oxidase 3-like isoform X2 [Leptopilina heterotoma]